MKPRSLAAAAVLAVALLARPSLAQPARGAAPVRRYHVTMKFWKATVAGVSTIAVTNLPADAFDYDGETVEFAVRNESPATRGSPSTRTTSGKFLSPRRRNPSASPTSGVVSTPSTGTCTP